MPKITDLVGTFFCENYKIDTDQKYIIETIPARNLLVNNRIDIIAKYKYIDFYIHNYDMTFIKEVYKKHLEAFTNGTFVEMGQENKNSFDCYVKTFEKLIKEIKEQGIDANKSVIPVGRENSIMDGSHRTAIAAYFNMNVPIIRFNQLYPQNGTEFFRKRYLEIKYLDYLVTEYMKLKKNIYVACFWPRATAKEKELSEAEKVLNKTFSIVYKKDIRLNYQGLKNLMAQIYSDKEWMGNIESGFKGATSKADACYSNNEVVSVYVLEGNGIQEILQAKAEIRDIFKIGNHSIHITDTLDEALQIAGLALNKNSLDLLNRGQPFQDIRLNNLIEQFRDIIQKKNYETERFIIDSSAVMGLYGIRNCRDLDYMTLEELNSKEKTELGDCHDDYLKYYGKTKEELILNPENHLYYHGMKFVSLEVLYEFKKNRNEEKDIYDNILISKFNECKVSSTDAQLMNAIKIRRLKRNIHHKARHIIISSLKRLHLYEVARKLKHFLKKLKKNKGAR